MTGARVIAAPHFGNEERIDAIAPLGSNIEEIVRLSLPGVTPDIYDCVRVTIGNDIVPVESWQSVRPKPTTLVVLQVVPGNQGALRSVLSISVAVAALALGQYYAAPIALGGVAVSASTTGAIITGTTLLAGTFLINSLVPVRRDNSAGFGGGAGSASPSYSVSGFRNTANPDGVIPCVMGKTRFAPPYAALPYTESSGGENYLRAMFLVGYGPVAISDIRLGDTPIDKYKELTYEVREGYATDAPLTIYNKQVLEERFSVDLNKSYASANGAHTRFTASDVTNAEIEIQLPSGLSRIITNPNNFPIFVDGYGIAANSTSPIPLPVSFNISYRLNGTGGWTTAGWTITDNTQKAKSHSYSLTFPTRGRYEIKVERVSDDYDDFNNWVQYQNYISISYWSAIRSFRPEYPINFNKPLALIAVRVRASKQLNGVIDNLTCIASRICKDWDSASGTWITRETQNPGSLYRFALQGPAAAYPLTDSQVDIANLQTFAEYCNSKSLKYNRVHDFEASIFEVVSDICAAGRGAPRDDGMKWGVVIDNKKTIVVQHMTPRNSWEFSGERSYVIFPHAFRVKFYDETNNYKPAERVIPWPDFSGTPTILESLDLPGVTSPDQVWKEARKRQYELIYRRDTWTLMQDWEGMIARRGDLVRVSHDILDRAHVAARVKAVQGQFVVIDELVTMEAGKSYGIRIRRLESIESTDDKSLVASVQTNAGETDTLLITSGDLPAVGELVMFGELSNETTECVVRDVEGAENFSRRFTLVRHAPEIFDLVDADTPPAWNGRVGAAV